MWRIFKRCVVSNSERKENLKQVVEGQQLDFNRLAQVHKAVNFEREASFALQILQSNDYLTGIAMKNQDSLKRAVLNVAAIGLSLNPMQKWAYLVPRDGAIYLDISFRGYIQLFVDIGALKWVKAEIVFEKDTFKYQGMNKEPLHEFDPFGERGAAIGVYCLAKSHDGDFFFDFMTKEDVNAIRDRSQSYKSHIKDGKQTPWVTDPGEMWKKTMIKRAQKSWPLTDTRQSARVAEALDVTNDIDFNAPAVTAIAAPASHQDESATEIRELLEKLSRTEAAYISHATRLFRREIKALSDLTPQETNTALVQSQ